MCQTTSIDRLYRGEIEYGRSMQKFNPWRKKRWPPSASIPCPPDRPDRALSVLVASRRSIRSYFRKKYRNESALAATDHPPDCANIQPNTPVAWSQAPTGIASPQCRATPRPRNPPGLHASDTVRTGNQRTK